MQICLAFKLFLCLPKPSATTCNFFLDNLLLQDNSILQINVQIIDWMLFKSNAIYNANLPEITLSRKPMKRVQCFKYLDHCVVEDLKDNQDIERERPELWALAMTVVMCGSRASSGAVGRRRLRLSIRRGAGRTQRS
ncbi:hypothetical protein ACJJTC_013429 [Scirpophaga incertulas]